MNKDKDVIKCGCLGGELCQKSVRKRHLGVACNNNAKARTHLVVDGVQIPCCIGCKSAPTANANKTVTETVITQVNTSQGESDWLGNEMRGVWRLMQDFTDNSIDTTVCPLRYQNTVGIVLQQGTYELALDLKEYQLLEYLRKNKPWNLTTNHTIRVLLKLANYRLNSSK